MSGLRVELGPLRDGLGDEVQPVARMEPCGAGKQSRAACGKGGMFSMPLRSRRHRADSLWGICKVQRSGVESSANEKRRLRVERGRRRPPEGQSSALAGAETCRNRFQTRPPGTPFISGISKEIEQTKSILFEALDKAEMELLTESIPQFKSSIKNHLKSAQAQRLLGFNN